MGVPARLLLLAAQIGFVLRIFALRGSGPPASPVDELGSFCIFGLAGARTPGSDWVRFAYFPSPARGLPAGWAELGSFCTFSLSGDPARLPVWRNWLRFARLPPHGPTCPGELALFVQQLVAAAVPAHAGGQSVLFGATGPGVSADRRKLGLFVHLLEIKELCLAQSRRGAGSEMGSILPFSVPPRPRASKVLVAAPGRAAISMSLR